jgi:hypothetical protein
LNLLYSGVKIYLRKVLPVISQLLLIVMWNFDVLVIGSGSRVFIAVDRQKWIGDTENMRSTEPLST